MTEPDRIRCEEVVAHLLEFLDGEIDIGRRERIEQHLAECRGCYSRAEFERVLRQRLRTLDDASPPDSLRRRLKSLLDAF
ncbi:anti-sigma factor family protein [Aromatoleum toluclasticum]|uniref:anti-sigma factor family protein n=1 Tax=Aromatoleum toluclasticum TaxID=92003 RepID=UPI00036680DB|nr:zf-HC2 domain-containing protein [Aromatoleum toluclasticum]